MHLAIHTITNNTGPAHGTDQGGESQMNEKSKIKVVKRSEAKAKPSKGKKPQTSRAVAREMVSTVTDWVTELKDRKSVETKAALELLFGGTQRPRES